MVVVGIRAQDKNGANPLFETFKPRNKSLQKIHLFWKIKKSKKSRKDFFEWAPHIKLSILIHKLPISIYLSFNQPMSQRLKTCQ